MSTRQRTTSRKSLLLAAALALMVMAVSGFLALRLLRRPLQANGPASMSPELAAAWRQHLISRVFAQSGDLDRAMATLSKAMETETRLHAWGQVCEAYTDLGNIYSALGQYEHAEAAYASAADLIRHFNQAKISPSNRGLVARDLSAAQISLAAIELRKGDTDSARSLLDSAWKQNGTIGIGWDTACQQAAICELRAQIARGAGKPREADELDQSAIDAAAHVYDQTDKAIAMTGLGQDALLLKDNSKARSAFMDAYEIFSTSGNNSGTIDAVNGLARLSQAENRIEDALGFYQKAIAASERGEANLVDPAELGGYQRTQPNIYASCASLLLRTGKPARALQIAERGRGHGLAREVRRNHIRLERFLTAAELRHLTGLSKALGDAADKLKSLSEPQPSAKAEFLRAHEQYSAYYDSLLDKKLLPRLVVAEPSGDALSRIARRHPDTLYIEYVFPDEGHGIVLTLASDGIYGEPLPAGAGEVSALAKEWRNALVLNARDEQTKAKALYQAVMAPIADQISTRAYRHLVIVPDGPLLGLPIGALMDEQGRRIIDWIPVSTSASLAMLDWKGMQPLVDGSVLCVAAPTPPRSADQIPDRERSGLCALAHAHDEAEMVCSSFSRSLLLSGDTARKQTVETDMSRYEVVHFATHGYLDADDGLQSWLLLSPGPHAGQDDVRLAARDIVDIPLTSQLVVLSACETARGEPSGGEGLLGLSWAFRAAGCPAVIGSEWCVEDRSTCLLMTAFYRELRRGLPKDEALRQAILSLRSSNTTYSAPYYWAPFQLFGDFSPIAVRRLH